MPAKRIPAILLGAVCAGWAASPAYALFHFMQIEQVIGGVNGDETAQAIQLRMRSGGQNLVSSTRLIARDAAGQNPVLLVDFTTNVTNAALGSRILVASSSFANYTQTGLDSDFTLTNLIPESYLPAGRLTFESDGGQIYWSLAWGGSAYTGSNTGTLNNDADGNFGPPWSGALPSTTRQGLLFQNGAGAFSTNNLADYALTVGDAMFTNNDGASFHVVSYPGDANGDGMVSGADYTVWADNFGDFSGNAEYTDGDFNHDGFVTGADYTLWADNFGFSAEAVTVPEPTGLILAGAAGAAVVCSMWALRRRPAVR